MKIALITCTGDRLIPLALCREFVERSTVQPSQWIVIDDGERSTLNIVRGCACDYVRRIPRYDDPLHTLPLNLLMARQFVGKDIDYVVFWEDDDWYSPLYLSWIIDSISTDSPILIGQADAMYYRLKAQQYQTMGNDKHASLCATAMHVSLLDEMVAICRQAIDPFIDIHLWRRYESISKILRHHPYVVGIKQLPGRQGRTYGWRGGDDFLNDPDGSVLRSWVGDADAEMYQKIVQEEAS